MISHYQPEVRGSQGVNSAVGTALATERHRGRTPCYRWQFNDVGSFSDKQ